MDKRIQKWLVTGFVVGVVATFIMNIITALSILNFLPFSQYIIGGISFISSTYILSEVGFFSNYK